MAPRQSTTGKRKRAARKPSAPYAPEFLSLEDSKAIQPLDGLEVDLDLEAIKSGRVPARTRGRIEKLANDRLASTMQLIEHRRRAALKALAQERSGWRAEIESTPPESRSSTPGAISEFEHSLQVPTSFPESNIRATVDAGPTTSDRASRDGRPQVENAFPERTNAIREEEVSVLLRMVEFEASPVAKCPCLEACGQHGEEDALRSLPYPLNNKEFLRLYVAPLFELEMDSRACEERFLAQEPAVEERKTRLLDRFDRCVRIAARTIAVVDAVDRSWEASLSGEEPDRRTFFLCRKAYRELEEVVEAETSRHRNCPYWTFMCRMALLQAEKRVEEQLWKTPMLVGNMLEPANDK
ncbi:hypothetical protein CLAIMM_11450 [Cladophialophora immunda]|nr:hypothetical protein CLAIMM_11450 [Cladophialophora immunda]